jgi:hypothetical protein
LYSILSLLLGGESAAIIVRVSIGVERLRALEKEGERRKRNFSSPNLIAAIHRCSLHFLGDMMPEETNPLRGIVQPYNHASSSLPL